MVNSANTTGPSKPRKIKKPKLQIMNTEIATAIKAKKQAFYNWKMNGRSVDPSNIELIRKKKQQLLLFVKKSA